jgi:hypothetical protein
MMKGWISISDTIKRTQDDVNFMKDMFKKYGLEPSGLQPKPSKIKSYHSKSDTSTNMQPILVLSPLQNLPTIKIENQQKKKAKRNYASS